MILAHVILSGAFAWIYARGVEAKPWMAQGVRFGVAVSLQPMPGNVVIKQMVFDGILMVILGMVAAWLYRDTAAPLRTG
jgi:hypothetical protein